MSKPYIHALSSVRRWGGKVEDYLPVHDLMDSSKAVTADVRHRALTHNSWFISVIVEKIFGTVIINSDNKPISTRDIAEQHVSEDFGGRFIPSAHDYITLIEYEEWMTSGKGKPPESHRKLDRKVSETSIRVMTFN